MIDLFIVEMEIREAASHIPPDIGLELRPFFGGLGGWASGRFFAFASRKDGLFLKLAETDQIELLAAAGLDEGTHHGLGRLYLLVPPGVMSDPGALQTWVERSVMHAITLPLPKRRRKT